MWETKFEPYKLGEKVGTIIATYNKGLSDEFIFTRTVNLEDTKGIDDFVIKAKEALAEHVKPVDSSITAKLEEVKTNLNK